MFDVSVHMQNLRGQKAASVSLSFWYLTSFPFINKPEKDKRWSVKASGFEDFVPFFTVECVAFGDGRH